jgi:hypothetical protein
VDRNIFSNQLIDSPIHAHNFILLFSSDTVCVKFQMVVVKSTVNFQPASVQKCFYYYFRKFLHQNSSGVVTLKVRSDRLFEVAACLEREVELCVRGELKLQNS